MYLYSDFIYRICLRAAKLKYLSARRVISDKINMFKNKYAPRFILSRYMRLKNMRSGGKRQLSLSPSVWG